jgi:hypothetical protein
VDRNTRYKALVRILESFGLEVRDGKGSEKILRDPRRTRRIHCIAHHGSNAEVPRQVIAALRRKFELDERHGVTDEEFYERA